MKKAGVIVEQNIWQLIHKRFTDRLSSSEEQALLSWINLSEENKLLYKHCERFYESSADLTDSSFDPNQSWLLFKNKIENRESAREKIKLFFPQSTIHFGKIAAVIIFFIVAGTTIYIRYFDETLIRQYNAGPAPTLVYLPDSTSIWLNAHSSVTWRKTFKKNRTVHLNGEAYFEVRKNPDLPFIVSAVNTETRVMGTSFNLHAFPNSDSVELSVLTGKVSFIYNENATSVTFLQAGQRVAYNKTANVISPVNSNDPNVLAWKTRTLIFQETALHDVIASLNRHYQTDITCNAEIKSCKFTGTFRNLTLSEALESISLSLGLNLHSLGLAWSLSGQACNN